MIREFEPLPTPCESLCGADIYTGRGLVAALPALLDERTGGGRLLLVYDEEGRAESERVEEALRGFGTRVTVKSAEDAPLAEECCMLALGVGGEPAFAAARSAARVRGAECALLPVTPSEDGVLDGGADVVFLDDEVLERAPADAFAAAVGMLAGGTNLPVVCFALGLELFGYNEPMLLFIATAIAYATSGKHSIYQHQRQVFYRQFR